MPVCVRRAATQPLISADRPPAPPPDNALTLSVSVSVFLFLCLCLSLSVSVSLCLVSVSVSVCLSICLFLSPPPPPHSTQLSGLDVWFLFCFVFREEKKSDLLALCSTGQEEKVYVLAFSLPICLNLFIIIMGGGGGGREGRFLACFLTCVNAAALVNHGPERRSCSGKHDRRGLNTDMCA